MARRSETASPVRLDEAAQLGMEFLRARRAQNLSFMRLLEQSLRTLADVQRGAGAGGATFARLSVAQPAEADRIRESADTLLFAEDGHDDASLLALLELVGLTDHLHESGRWTAERTARLNADVRACGPQPAADELPRAA
jgi:hypothetical protein